MVKLAFTPLKATEVVPVKWAPAMTTAVPAGPADGSKLAITGGKEPTAKELGLVALPSAVVIVIGPLVAPGGTVAVTCVEEFTEKLAFVPLN